MAGASGEVNIVEKFCVVYEELYNSSGSKEVLSNMKKEMSKSIELDNESSAEVFRITGDVVKAATCKMKPVKGDVSEGYSSDVLLNTPDSLFHQLALVYRSWLIHGTVTLNLLDVHFYLFRRTH